MTQIATYSQLVPALTARVPVNLTDTADLLAALMPSASVNINTAGLPGGVAQAYTAGNVKMTSVPIPRNGVLQVVGNVAVVANTAGPGTFDGGFFMTIYYGTTGTTSDLAIATATWWTTHATQAILGGIVMNPRVAVQTGHFLTLSGNVITSTGTGTWKIVDSVDNPSTIATYANNFSYNYIG